MVDDLHHLGLLDPLHTLFALVVVDHDELGTGLAQEGGAGHEALEGTVLEDGQRTQVVVGEDIPRLVKEAVRLDVEPILADEHAHRDGEAQQAEGLGSVEAADEDRSLVCIPVDLAGNLTVDAGEDHRRDLHLDRLLDVVLTIPDDQYRLDVSQGSHLAAESGVPARPDHDRGIKGLLVTPFEEGSLNDLGKVVGHKMVGGAARAVLLEDETTDIIDGHQGPVLPLLHDGDDRTQAGGAIEGDEGEDRVRDIDGDLTGLDHTLDFSPDIANERRSEETEALELGTGRLIEGAAPHRYIVVVRIGLVLQVCVAIGRADAVHIGVSMSCYVDIRHMPSWDLPSVPQLQGADNSESLAMGEQISYYWLGGFHEQSSSSQRPWGG